MSQQRNEDRFVCVWLDNQLIRSEDYIDTQDELRTVVKSFRTFSNSNQCVDFITDITDAKIFFITTNILGKIIVPLIYLCEQIDSIYIFYSNKSPDDNWTDNYDKIKGVFNDVKLICDRFKQDSSQFGNDSIAISFISSGDVNSHNINRQDPSFMYSQLLKEVLLNDHFQESDEQTKIDLLIFCRTIYAGNKQILNIVDEFERDFIPELAIYWYTRESFLYRILNKALWTPEPDVLYKLRYFLRHLHRQISSEAAKQRDDLSPMIVYRGQSMSTDEIEKIKGNLGGFLSFNNFLSTTLQEEVARNFLWGSYMGVLFEMHIDPTIQKFPFVNIEQLSYLQGHTHERELLFSLGSVFRISRIEKQEHFYRVQLMLSGEVDEQLANYTMRTREEIRSPHSFLSLLRLMNELAQYSSVNRFDEILQDDIGLAGNPPVLAAVHHMFGTIYLSRGQSKDALNHLHKSLDIYLNYLPADHPKLSPTYNNIGSVHLAQYDYDKALVYQQLALDCQSNSEEPDLSSIVTYTNNMAKIYHSQEKYSEALVLYKRSLESQKKHLGENDLSLAETYNLISSTCFKQGDYVEAASYHEKAVALEEKISQLDPKASADGSVKEGTVCLSRKQYPEALNHFNRALEIQQQYFLPNHPSLAMTYHHIATAFYQQKRFEEALPNYIKALEIELSSLTDDHPSIATSYFNISTVYVGLSRWSDALENGLKAVEQLKKSFKGDPTTLAAFIHHVGHIYHQQDKYEDALIYYEESLEIYHTLLMENDDSLAPVYHRTASAYYQLKRYEDALPLYQKTLEIELRTLPDNAKTISVTYSNLCTAYLGLKQYDEALIAVDQAIDQLRKTLPNNHPEVVQHRAFYDHIREQQFLADSSH